MISKVHFFLAQNMTFSLRHVEFKEKKRLSLNSRHFVFSLSRSIRILQLGVSADTGFTLIASLLRKVLDRTGYSCFYRYPILKFECPSPGRYKRRSNGVHRPG